MTAGFERDIGGGTPRLASLRERIDFRMRHTGRVMIAFADNPPVFHEYATDARVRFRGIVTALSELQSAGHEFEIANVR